MPATESRRRLFLKAGTSVPSNTSGMTDVSQWASRVTPSRSAELFLRDTMYTGGRRRDNLDQTDSSLSFDLIVDASIISIVNGLNPGTSWQWVVQSFEGATKRRELRGVAFVESNDDAPSGIERISVTMQGNGNVVVGT